MYIIIVGGGRVGVALAKHLLEENNEVLIVEREPEVCQGIEEEMGGICQVGDGCEFQVLSDAGVRRVDMLVAVTGSDEDNLVVCQIAKHRFGVARTVARVNNPGNEALFRKLGIDVTVSSINLILDYIEQEMPTHFFAHLFTLGDAKLMLAEVRIPAGSVADGKRLRDIPLPPGSLITLVILKGQRPQVPREDMVIQAEDTVLAVTLPENEDALRLALTEEAPPAEAG